MLRASRATPERAHLRRSLQPLPSATPAMPATTSTRVRLAKSAGAVTQRPRGARRPSVTAAFPATCPRRTALRATRAMTDTRGSLGRQCGQCHNTKSWKGATFSHSRLPRLTRRSLGMRDVSPQRHRNLHLLWLSRTCTPEHPQRAQDQLTCINQELRAVPRRGRRLRASGLPNDSRRRIGLHHVPSQTEQRPTRASAVTSTPPPTLSGEHDGRSLSSIRNCASCHRGGGDGEGGEGGGGREGGGHREGREGHGRAETTTDPDLKRDGPRAQVASWT